MAYLENLKNMYDVSLKPRMLLTLLKEDIPDEKKPLEDSSRLSSVVSTVQNLKLLSESFSSSMDVKLIERCKSAVNDWFDRLLSLVANTSMPDKCWAGICLLGVSFQECSSDRFLSSYGVWFDKLLWHIQIKKFLNLRYEDVPCCLQLLQLHEGGNHFMKTILQFGFRQKL